MQAVLTALTACPKDADVQRWGCQALVPLFGDPVVAAPFRQAGIAAVIRALAMLQDVETALKSMGAVSASGKVGSAGRGAVSGGPGASGLTKRTAGRERWARAMKKVKAADVCHVRERHYQSRCLARKRQPRPEWELEGLVCMDFTVPVFRGWFRGKTYLQVLRCFPILISPRPPALQPNSS